MLIGCPSAELAWGTIEDINMQKAMTTGITARTVIVCASFFIIRFFLLFLLAVSEVTKTSLRTSVVYAKTVPERKERTARVIQPQNQALAELQGVLNSRCFENS